jgi:NitT/TauT family transport system permease protein
VTLEEAMGGFLTGAIAGVVAGILLGRHRLAAEVLSIYIKVANAVPRIVLAPIFIMSFGLGMTSKVAVAFVMVFFVVFANAFQGVREADRAIVTNARILGASPWQVTSTVVIPSAMSWIFASLHVSFGFAIVGAVVGELLGARYGVGQMIAVAQGNFDAAGVFAGMVVLIAVALAAEWAMTVMEARLARWRPAPQTDFD